MNRPRKPSQRRRRKPISVTLVTCSLGLGVAELVDAGDEFKACGFVYPGASAEKINGKLHKLPQDDVTVIQAGSINCDTQGLES